MSSVLDAIVIGGGQAGLAMAWHLKQQNQRFLVLDAGPDIGHSWRSRWDSLVLFTPAQYDALPAMAFPAPADSYPTKDQVSEYLRDYVAAFDLPVRLDSRVTGLCAWVGSSNGRGLVRADTNGRRAPAGFTAGRAGPSSW